MITSKKMYVYILSIILLSSACRKEDNLNANSKWVVYLPYQVTTDIPVDLNFDGQSHTDLTKELPIESNSIYVQYTNLTPVININWIEPLFNNSIFLKALPDTLSDTTTITYLPAAQQYYYHFAMNCAVVVPDSKLVNDNTTYFTFVFPDTVYINNNLLEFTTWQNVFVSRQSHRQIVVTAVFKKDREEYR